MSFLGWLCPLEFYSFAKKKWMPSFFSPRTFYCSTYLKSGFPLIISLLLPQCYQAHVSTSTWLPFPFPLTKFWIITTLLKIPISSPHTHTTNPSAGDLFLHHYWLADLITVSWEKVAQLLLNYFWPHLLSYTFQLYSENAIFSLLYFHSLHPPFLCLSMC